MNALLPGKNLGLIRDKVCVLAPDFRVRMYAKICDTARGFTFTLPAASSQSLLQSVSDVSVFFFFLEFQPAEKVRGLLSFRAAAAQIKKDVYTYFYSLTCSVEEKRHTFKYKEHANTVCEHTDRFNWMIGIAWRCEKTKCRLCTQIQAQSLEYLLRNSVYNPRFLLLNLKKKKRSSFCRNSPCEARGVVSLCILRFLSGADKQVYVIF